MTRERETLPAKRRLDVSNPRPCSPPPVWKEAGEGVRREEASSRPATTEEERPSSPHRKEPVLLLPLLLVSGGGEGSLQGVDDLLLSLPPHTSSLVLPNGKVGGRPGPDPRPCGLKPERERDEEKEEEERDPDSSSPSERKGEKEDEEEGEREGRPEEETSGVSARHLFSLSLSRVSLSLPPFLSSSLFFFRSFSGDAVKSPHTSAEQP